ncbi:PREDICTED: uncharacterized protein LOC106323296 [Brassica oleracea var. oleracea]|uniref:uncharacterized protein LOC106323296 n=1 Tax=Brassica oleracea var. oleracea TaxID=109376 RepID=UPI0006A7055A|nr:PREDICTED: uncharacterized protein LOC106323296 [Brassica oleracea var. oleracea]
MKAEIESIIKNKIWKLVKKPAGVKPIGLKCIYKIKRNGDGTVIKYKARLVAKGYVQQQGIDFDEVFAPVALRAWNIKLDRTSLNGIKQFKDDMSRRFEMSDLEMLTYYLGIEVTQGADGIHIKQEGYTQGILVKTKMESCNYTHDLMHTSLKVSKAEEEPEIDATSYRSIIGCLRCNIVSKKCDAPINGLWKFIGVQKINIPKIRVGIKGENVG